VTGHANEDRGKERRKESGEWNGPAGKRT
jgi:hypothetical protein